MPRFLIDKNNILNNRITIDGEEARHIAQVLRFRANDPIALFDREGTVYQGVIAKTGRRQVQVEIIDRMVTAQEDGKRIILGQALPKSKKMDLIVQKCTELGISEIIPFYSARSIPRFDERKSGDRVRHWQKIAVASVKQSGVARIPSVERIVDFKNVVTRDYPGYLKIILWEEEAGLRLRNVLEQDLTLHHIIFLVGPEGGFTVEEIELAKEHGFVSISLGDTILRAETVSIALLSIVRYEMGALG